MTIVNGSPKAATRTMPGGTSFAGRRVNLKRGGQNGPGPTSSAIARTGHFDFPLHQSPGNADVNDRRFPQRPPRRIGPAVWAVVRVSAGNIGLDRGDP